MKEMNEQKEVGVQVRCEYKASMIHVQGIGAEENRDYGLSIEFRVPTEVTDWLCGQVPTVRSKASTNALFYIPAEMNRFTVDDGYEYQMVLKSTVEGGDAYNHPDGLVLNMHKNTMNIMQFISFCDTNSIFIDVDGTPFTQESDAE